MKTKIIASIVMLMLAIAVFTTVAIAWFTPSAQYIENIVVTSGTIDVSAQLLRIEDFDLDGSPDIINDNYIYTPINEINIPYMKPGDVYSYRLNLKNIGEANGDLSLRFDGISEELKKVLTFSSVVKDSNDAEIIGAGTSGKKLFSGADLGFGEITGLEPVEETANPQAKVYFYITFEKLEDLKILNPTIFDTVEDLNDYQVSTFSIAKIIVHLSQAV